MKVKKIRMVGFKSFADETLIELQPGITCIVGPNGCGKSNILDAVRWVLGEKSARGLRGKSMEDVIFLGSEQRKPAGMAEVEIYFDNTDRTLKLDLDEVVVGRRIYVSAGSEYYLNGKRCTRRELERILMDTGIGKSAYSIMEQGRMSEILKSTPEARRALLDEAAGVSRFKLERRETLDRLEATEQNMLRLGDILKAKKEEIDHLERQAKKTRRYMKLKEELDQHDLNLRFLNYTAQAERSRKAEEKLIELKKRRDEAIERQRAAETSIVEIESRNEAELEELQRLDRALHQDISNLENMRASVERLDSEKKDKIRKREQMAARLTEEEKKRRELEERHQASKQLELNLSQDLATLVEQGKKADLSIAGIRESIDRSVEREEEGRAEILVGETRQAELLTDLQNVTRDLILELERKKKELESRETLRSGLKRDLLERLERSAETLTAIENYLANAAPPESERRALEKRLRELQFARALEDFQKYEAIEQEFRSLLFDKSGLLARKEELDIEMQKLAERRDFLQKEAVQLQHARKDLSAELEIQKNRKVELDINIRDAEVRRESQAETLKGIESQLKEAGERVTFLREEFEALDSELRNVAEEELRVVGEMESVRRRLTEQSGAIEGLKKRIEQARAQVQELREQARRELESFERALPEISQQERNAEQFRVAISTLEEELYNDFQMSLGELAERCETLKLDKNREDAEFRRIQAEIKELGAFNALAIEELERAAEAYAELEKQRADIENARKDILAILKEIDGRSQTLFQDAYERIQVNFQEIFQTLFNGGRASLSMTEPDDLMNSGVDIMVQPAGKKNSTISLLSGGEQSMTAIALMFAIYLVRPSPFCFLDEIDAPLDDTNVARFLRMLGRFTPRSQFLVITHNKLTMSRGEAIFGVTQEEAGVSKLVSVRFREARETAV